MIFFFTTPLELLCMLNLESTPTQKVFTRAALHTMILLLKSTMQLSLWEEPKMGIGS